MDSNSSGLKTLEKETSLQSSEPLIPGKILHPKAAYKIAWRQDSLMT